MNAPQTPLASLQRLSRLLDSSIPLPGGRTVGLDGLIGLIPGYGDVAGAALSGYIIVKAARMGVPRSVLLRMGLNVGLETLVGAIPVVGDLFDFVWKSNQKNVALIESSVRERTLTKRKSSAIVAGVVVGLVALLALGVTLSVLLVSALWRAVAGA